MLTAEFANVIPQKVEIQENRELCLGQFVAYHYDDEKTKLRLVNRNHKILAHQTRYQSILERRSVQFLLFPIAVVCLALVVSISTPELYGIHMSFSYYTLYYIISICTIFDTS